MQIRTLKVLTKGRDNNFNFIRMLAAYCVLISHSFPISGSSNAEPLDFTGMSLGSISVAVFFTVSGFFITKSWMRRSTARDFAFARAARILPSLIVVTVLTVFVLGPLVTTASLSEYFGSKATWAYLFHNVTLYSVRYELPGVFTGNPYDRLINGSLWTLPYEVGCYILAAIALTGAHRFKFLPLLVNGLVAVAFLCVPVTEEDASRGYRLALAFFFGSAAYSFADRVPLHWSLLTALAAVAYLLADTAYYLTAYIAALGYGALYFGALDIRGLRGYNKLGDYSYGTYILAFPIQQTFAFYHGPSSPWLMTAVVTPIVLGLSVLSWVLIEKPSLYNRHLLSDLRFLRWRRTKIDNRPSKGSI